MDDQNISPKINEHTENPQISFTQQIKAGSFKRIHVFLFIVVLHTM